MLFSWQIGRHQGGRFQEKCENGCEPAHGGRQVKKTRADCGRLPPPVAEYNDLAHRARRVALWGESFAPVNAPDADLKVPYPVAKRPAQSEPLGGLLVLLGALYEDDVRAVLVRGGLSDYRSVLETPYTYLPLDAVVPGALTTGDLPALAAALAPRPLRIEALVDVQRVGEDQELLDRQRRSTILSADRVTP